MLRLAKTLWFIGLAEVALYLDSKTWIRRYLAHRLYGMNRQAALRLALTNAKGGVR